MKRLSLTPVLVLLVSTGCAHHVATATTELVPTSKEQPRTVQGETWDAPYCVQNARVDRVRVLRYSTRGHVAAYIGGGSLVAFGLIGAGVAAILGPQPADVALTGLPILAGGAILAHGIFRRNTEPETTREVVATDEFGAFSSTGCAQTPPLPVVEVSYCGDFDPTVAGADDAGRDAEEMCLQPIQTQCSATRDLACRAATVLLSNFPEGWSITFQATTPEQRMLELVDRHLAPVEVSEVVRASPLAVDAQSRAVSMMSGVAARRLAPAFEDALAQLREEIDAETGERRQILLEMHNQTVQIAAFKLSNKPDETQIRERRRILRAQADWPPPHGQESADVASAETRESIVADSPTAKPAASIPRGQRPRHEEVDWSGEVVRELSAAACPGPVLILPASLAADELRAVDVLGQTISYLGRQTIVGSSGQTDFNCTLLVHSPRRTNSSWQWEIDVRGTQAGTAHLEVVDPPYLVSDRGTRGPTVWDPSMQTVVSGEDAYALLDPVEAETVRATRRSRASRTRVWLGVGVGTFFLILLPTVLMVGVMTP